MSKRSPLTWSLFGILALFFSFIFLIFGLALVVPNEDDYFEKNYTRVHESGYESDQKVYACEGEPKQVADKIAQDLSSMLEARAEDTKTNTWYLRLNIRLAQVTKRDGKCRIIVENLQRLRSGHYVFVGPGFRPPSPGSSSGGSSGSGSGSTGSGNSSSGNGSSSSGGGGSVK
ncbi:MAG: DUF4247 domain-containing protein [Corynebacterium sp.]|nr:DUF4247 domain-containing protein [Corynebacterium sp.]